MTKALIVQTTIVSTKGSRPATTPSRIGSLVLAAECATGEDPWPASFENKALCMPSIKAEPTAPPMNALLASSGENAALKIKANMEGI